MNLAKELFYDDTFPHNLLHNFPHSLHSINKARVMILVDSTMLPKAPRYWLMMDVVLFTMPFCTIQ